MPVVVVSRDDSLGLRSVVVVDVDATQFGTG